MRALHIVQGGVENGDKAWLERASRLRLDAPSWVAPKSANVGDEVVIFVLGYGFFATARVKSLPKLRLDWANRYGAGLTAIRLIEPAISFGTIRREIPQLKWTSYPRSITTPSAEVAERIRAMIAHRRKTGFAGLDDKALRSANVDELRKIALSCARSEMATKKRSANYRVGSQAIHHYVLRRANGRCEGCKTLAPFRKPDGSPYLEPHHTTRRADGGPDHPAHVIALCPNCHRRAHYAADAGRFNGLLKRKVSDIEHRRRK